MPATIALGITAAALIVVARIRLISQSAALSEDGRNPSQPRRAPAHVILPPLRRPGHPELQDGARLASRSCAYRKSRPAILMVQSTASACRRAISSSRKAVELYPSWEEIREYFRYVDEKLALSRDIRFNRRVNAAEFDATRNRWTVRSSDGSVSRPRYLVL